MDILLQFAAILFGVVVSIVLPIIVKWTVLPDKADGFSRFISKEIKPYILAGVAAIIISLLILAIAPGMDTFAASVIQGIGWQSFIKNLQPSAS